jgi:adenylate cyclase
MNCRRFIIGATLFCFSVKGLTQTGPVQSVGNGNDTALVNSIIQQSTDVRNNDPVRSLTLAAQAKDLAEKIGFQKGAAYAYKNIGLAYLVQGNYVEALQNYQLSLKLFEEIKFDEGIANLLGNIGVIYYYQSDNVKALDYYLRSLKIAERTGNKLRIMSMLNNIGAIYGLKSATYDKALVYYLQALPLCEELGDKDALGGISVNVGEIYFDKKDYEKALSYYNKALKAYGSNSEGIPNAYNAIGKLYLRQGKYQLALYNHNMALQTAQRVNGKLNIVPSYTGLARVYEKENDFRSALAYFKKAEETALELGVSSLLSDIYKEMSAAYSKTGDYAYAFKYQTLYANVKDTLYNIETDKKLASRQFDFDLQKKQGEIDLLTKDKSLKEAELKRQKLVKNAFLVGLVLVFFITFIIYRNYKAKVRINKILDRQKEQIEHLLLNILPVEVAKELQHSGRATPRNYESVSVLFTDFKGFTAIADKLSPAELVDELNICFMAFDDIIERNKLEKIKTIGDSYMCAGGIPTPDNEHPFNIIKAGLEIQYYVSQNNLRRAEKGLPPWDVRVGVHVGPLVAGVVGRKKYAYDIWGSTVNIASRMESNGEPGKVNISASAYELIKDKYACKYRGKIYAKNVGEIDMYFIDYEMGDEESRMKTDALLEDNRKMVPENEPEKFDLDTLYG